MPHLTPPPTRHDHATGRRSSTTSARRVTSAVVFVLVALLSACTAANPTMTSEPAGTTSAAPRPVGTQPPTTLPEPDKLADPGVGPGQCKVIVYTPPTAKEPMPGELCRPKDNQRDVAIIVVHGGSGISGSYQGMRRWANRYLVEGYVTFLPEYHLFNPGGETPVFPHPEQNILAAVQFLRGTGTALGIRKDRIVVQGQSAGARVGAVAFTSADDNWFAGPELYPSISDEANGFIGFYHPYDGTMQYADQYFGGPEGSRDPAVQKRLEKADSLARAGNAAGPALFITGSKDWDVITLQQNAFAQVLHQRQIAAMSIVVNGGGHGFDEGGSRLSKLGEESAVDTLKWLNDNFPQLPSRDPQNVDADINSAPTYTGVPPSTYQPRPAPSGGYGTGSTSSSSGSSSRSGSKAGSGSGSGSISGSTTTAAPTTIVTSSTSVATTVAPSSTVPASSTPPTSPPVATAPPTTVPVPSTTSPKPVTTLPPTTAPPITKPPTIPKPVALVTLP